MVEAICVSISALISFSTELTKLAQIIKEINFSMWIPIILALILTVVVIVKFKVYSHFPIWILNKLKLLMKTINKVRKIKPLEDESLNKLIKDAGYNWVI